MNKIVLLSCIGLSVLILVASYSLREGSEAMPKNQSAVVPRQVTATTPPRRGTVVSPKRTPAPTSEQNPVETMEESAGEVRDFLAAVQRAAPFAGHRAKIKERIEELKKESLEESFTRLREAHGYVNGVFFASESLSLTASQCVDRKMMFSNRGFIRVFQEYKKLPHKEVFGKLNDMWEEAVWEFESLQERFLLALDSKTDPDKLAQHKQRLLEEEEIPANRHATIGGTSCMVYMTMLLAAYHGEIPLLISQLDEMQRIEDAFFDDLNRREFTVSPSFTKEETEKYLRRLSAQLEADVLFTILMYAAERAEIDVSEADVPWEKMSKEIVPLFSWDAEWNRYDFAVYRGDVQLDPRGADEQFSLYSFPEDPYTQFQLLEPQEKRAIVNALKEELSRRLPSQL